MKSNSDINQTDHLSTTNHISFQNIYDFLVEENKVIIIETKV